MNHPRDKTRIDVRVKTNSHISQDYFRTIYYPLELELHPKIWGIARLIWEEIANPLDKED